MAILECRDLTKRYTSFCLDQMNLTVEEGTIMGFIGENGAGKTTTLKLIMGLIHAESGEVKLFGKTMKHNEQEIKEKIGVVLGEHYFDNGVCPKEVNSIMKAVYKRWNSKQFCEYLNRFSLPNKKAIKDFSKGMKMKLALAVALSHEPELLLLDEVTSGLDPVVRNEILDLLLDFIQDENHSVLFSSHITSDIEKIADSITFVHEGRVIASGTREETFDRAGIVKGTMDQIMSIPKEQFIRYKEGTFGVNALIKDRYSLMQGRKDLTIDKASLEEYMYYYIKGEVL